MELFESLKQKISGKGLQIVFPEGTDARVLGAANRLYADKLITPVFIGNISEVTGTLISRGINPDGFQIYDPLNCERFEKMVEIFVERRKGKVTEEQAREILKDSNYFGTMLVHMGIADGMVSGAVHSTADTVRPALQIIKTKPGVKSVSGAFIMVRISLPIVRLTLIQMQIPWRISLWLQRKQQNSLILIQKLQCYLSQLKVQVNQMM